MLCMPHTESRIAQGVSVGAPLTIIYETDLYVNIIDSDSGAQACFEMALYEIGKILFLLF